MSRPIVRWTLGAANRKSSYRILDKSISAMINLYSDRFDYYVLYNDDVKDYEIDFLKNKHKKVSFLKQDWKFCPIKLEVPNVYVTDLTHHNANQKINGSFWKICPPRLDKNVHEIILDNDLIFLKKPKAIEDFLSRSDKNFIIKDSNRYLGPYADLFVKEKQGFNSGIIGLRPNYDFEKDIIKYSCYLDNKNDYGNEQGLLTYTLYTTDPIIGSSENFVGIHSDKIFLNCVSDERYKSLKEKDFDKRIFLHFFLKQEFNFEYLKEDLRRNAPYAVLLTKKDSLDSIRKAFENAEVIHFLASNRVFHFPWKYFLFKHM